MGCGYVKAKIRWVTALPALAATLLCGLMLCGGALAVDSDTYYADLTYDDLWEQIEEVGEYLGEYMPTKELDRMWQAVLKGEVSLDWHLAAEFFSAVFDREIGSTLRLFGELLILAVVGGLVAVFGKGEVAELAGVVISLAAAGLLVQALAVAGGAAAEAVALMSDFLYALLPVLLTLLASMSGASAVALFNPALLLCLSVELHILNIFVMPMLYISGALAIGNRMSGGLKLGGLFKLVRDLAVGVFGVMLAIFTALLGVLGLSSAVFAGLGWRAVKTAGSIFIPVVGRTLADALDSVVGTALLLKNVIGVAGILLLLLICIIPAVKILLMYVVFRLAAVLAEPLGNSDLAALLGDMANVVVMFFAVSAAAGLFFFFIISITVGMGDLMLALR